MLKRRTVRTRIAVTFGCAFLALGALLLTAVYLLTQHGTDALAVKIAQRARQPGSQEAQPSTGHTASPGVTLPGTDGTTITTVSRQVTDAAAQQQLLWSIVALAAAALLAALVGWWTAARLLRPVHEMTTTVRRISATNLHQRLAAGTPHDEITELADTFDDLLNRLESTFDAQKRFIANASHELRTPLAVQRSLIQVGLRDPDPAELEQVRNDLLDVNRRSEKLIDALILLAQGQHGLCGREGIDWTALVARETEAAADAARSAQVTLRLTQRPATTHGDPILLTHLVRNLIDNAVTHNHPGGTVDIHVDQSGLRICNTGPRLDDKTATELLEPFRRGPRPRLNTPTDGSGLGLSIVQAIATAHRAAFTAQANPDGGLTTCIRLPDLAGTGTVLA
ncbi:HAMP domain-containing sensor histidine kinase [Streptomyces sp. WAC06614]|uniref:sensor histidine kinase n=1 Tax=Streptomyces sp. WAC06614 TaxID=2487416 RepID=UPI0021B0315B|nr:ATP-binding protein [Streptomyces sp. WAC06614]